MIYEDFKIMRIKETFNFHRIDKWHELGIKGNGVVILNLEPYHEHGKDTYDMIKLIAPNSTVYSCITALRSKGGVITSFRADVNNRQGDIKFLELDSFEEFLNEIDIVTISKAGADIHDDLKEIYWRTDNILMGSAGNDGVLGVTGRFIHTGWSIGAIELRNGEIERKFYSAIGEEMDFACLTGHLEGTSFSSPIMAGLTALIIQRYGKMPQSKMEEVLKSISIDAGEVGFDTSFGWGVPVLPDAIRMLEPLIDGFLTTDTIFHTPLIQDNITDFTGREGYPMRAEYITIHNFGSSATARSITDYVDRTDAVKSWHFTVGKDAIYQEMSILKNGWHASDGEQGTGNRKSIGIEVEENLEATMNAVRLCVYLRNVLGSLEITTHQRWARDDKTCPRWILENIGIADFIKMVEVMEMKFKDVEESRWSFKAIDYVTDKGLMKGFPDGTFKPSDPLTREQMAQVLYNLKNPIT